MAILHPTEVSILIPSFNGKALLGKNLQSVIAAARNYSGSSEIIIIDDGSTDRTQELINSSFSEVKTIRLQNTSGYASACNYGASCSNGEILIFLNNDVKVDMNFIGPLLRHFENELVFAVGAMSVVGEKGYANETISQGFFKNGVLVFEYPARDTARGIFTRPRPILHVCGVAFACRRDRFFKLEGFDTIFKPIYWEDVDLSYRAWKRGWYSIYEPESIVYHEHSSTVTNYYSENYIKYISRRNRLLFYWKNITDLQLLIRHIFWLPWWMGLNILREGTGWIKSFAAAVSLLGDVKARRRKERQELIWPDARIIRFTREA